MRAIVFAALLALTACATAAKYEAVLDAWLGRTETQLVSQVGPPQSVYVAENGVRFLTYSTARNVVIPGVAPSYTSTVIGNTVYTRPVGGVAPVSMDFSCTTTFTVENGRITRWSYQGNDCAAF